MATALERESVGLLVQNEWLVQVQIELSRRDDDDGEAGENVIRTVLLSPDTTVAELKAVVHERLGIDPKEQRLYDVNNVPLFSGRLVGSSDIRGRTVDSAVRVRLQQVQLDPRLEALYQMTGYDNVNERDEITAKMLTPRQAGQCPAGHALTPLFEEGAGALISKQDCEKYACAICAWTRRPGGSTSSRINGVNGVVWRPMVCKCGFALCTNCLSTDLGRNTTQGDPHNYIESMAIQVARRLAVTACWFGGAGHCCGHPCVVLSSEYANRRLREKRTDCRSFSNERGFILDRQAKVVHDGARLIVRLDENVRQMLKEAGKEECIQELEANEIHPGGATTGDVINFREGVRRSKRGDIWHVIVTRMRNQFPLYHWGDGPATPYMKMKLMSCTTEEVVFEVGVGISDGDY